MEIFIIGAGTLGKLIAEIIESNNSLTVGGFYDDNFPKLKKVFDYNIIGKLSDINLQTSPNMAIGVGDPKIRKEIFIKMVEQGFTFPSLIHASVVLSKYSIVENGVIIGPNSSVLNGSRIGQGACLLSHVNVNQDVIVEPFCLIAAGVIIGNNAVLGEGCHIGLGNYVKLNQHLLPWTN